MSKQPGIIITSSPHKRLKSQAVPPAPPENFDSLREMTKEQLKDLGFAAWDETGLMLIPGEWYDFIPKGWEVIDISGNREKFEPGVTDNDIRFGCLAVGIIPSK